MGFDRDEYREAKEEARRLRYAEDDLKEVRKGLRTSKDVINNVYQAREVNYINDSIDAINDKLRKIYRELDDIEDDIKEVAREKYKEWKKKQDH